MNELRAEYDEESRVFKTMKKLLLVLGTVAAVGVLLLFILKLDTFPREAGVAGFMLAIPIIIFAVLLTGLFVGCIPAGYIWLWRAARRSRWSVWGSSTVLVVILLLTVLIPAVLGPFFYLAQWVRVNNLKRALESAGL